jgi:hypothetical protein
MVLASIPDVQQSVSTTDTGTPFLLNKNGINVVRQLQVEEEHQIQEYQKTWRLSRLGSVSRGSLRAPLEQAKGVVSIYLKDVLSWTGKP